MSTSIVVSNLSFTWPDGSVVFEKLDFALNPAVTALVGDNGAGKTTLLRLLAGELPAGAGSISGVARVGYLPQELPLRGEQRVADLLGISRQLAALRAIEAGDTDPENFAVIGEDWDVEERAEAVLSGLGLFQLSPDRRVDTLSGGEAMLIGFAGRLLQGPDVLILDEPTNNLDIVARQRLYDAIAAFNGTVIVVSHDRALLERVDTVAELRDGALRMFSGNIDDFEAAIDSEQEAAERMVRAAKADMNKQKSELADTQVKLARRVRYGKKMFENTREPRAVMRVRKRTAQESAGKLKGRHESELEAAKERLSKAEEQVRDDKRIVVDLPDTAVGSGKDIAQLRGLTFADMYGDGLDLHIQGPERIALLGANGSGKTTLLRLLIGQLAPRSGTVTVSVPVGYLSQRLDTLDDDVSVFDNVRHRNQEAPETILRTRLARFLFRAGRADQVVATLSGGERLRAALAATLSAEPPPQLLLLDEPTNNLDLASIGQLEDALAAYEGALLVASHDRGFLRKLGITRWLYLEPDGGVRDELHEPDDVGEKEQ
ncbi:MAG TPA: ATP-binding cassette domain-containing protein [Candidatus Stackebrandtia faecavium]|nr:ATP-binding cassette domain-containing protein [Candidatus Stackebrandtia faecavium]